MPPGLWLAQTFSRQILVAPTETSSHVDRDRFAFVCVACLGFPGGRPGHDREPHFGTDSLLARARPP
jgi:hypothetical protein